MSEGGRPSRRPGKLKNRVALTVDSLDLLRFSRRPLVGVFDSAELSGIIARAAGERRAYSYGNEWPPRHGAHENVTYGGTTAVFGSYRVANRWIEDAETETRISRLPSRELFKRLPNRFSAQQQKKRTGPIPDDRSVALAHLPEMEKDTVRSTIGQTGLIASWTDICYPLCDKSLFGMFRLLYVSVTLRHHFSSPPLPSPSLPADRET